MEIAVEQSRVENEEFSIKTNQVLNENDRLLEQVLANDIVNVVIYASACVNESVNDCVLSSVNEIQECSHCLKLEAEVVSLRQKVDYMQEHCISLQVAMQLNKEIFDASHPIVQTDNKDTYTFKQLFEFNNMKLQLEAKDKALKKCKKAIKKMQEKEPVDQVKLDFDEIETINIELENRVQKLISENDHLK